MILITITSIQPPHTMPEIATFGAIHDVRYTLAVRDQQQSLCISPL